MSSSSSSSSAAAAAAVAAAAGISLSSSSSDGGPAKSGIPTVAYSNPRRWTVVYPRYLDLDATIAQGRRIPKSFCISTPTVPDLLEAAQTLQLKIAFEDKMYSRDFWQRGRIRVQLRKDDGSWLNSNIQSKKSLLIQFGQIIPKLTNRPARMQQLDAMKKQTQQANMPFIMPQFVPMNPQQMQRAQAAAMASAPGAAGMGMGMGGGFPAGFPLGSPSASASASAPAAAPAASPSSSSSSSSTATGAGGSAAVSPESGGGGGEKKKKKKKGKK